MPPGRPLDTILQLLEDYHSFNPSGVPVLPYPTPLEFSARVRQALPCIYQVRHGSHQSANPSRAETADELAQILASPAWSWTADTLVSQVTEPVEVAVTPDGRADALYSLPTGEDEQVFVQPALLHMSMSELLLHVTPSTATPGFRSQETRASSSPVHYLQSQNSNLTTTQLSPLHTDLPPTLPFASPTLGEPDATNIWIGDARSVTSTHRDPYENLYLVLRGSKTFTLWAPVDEACLDARPVRTGRHLYSPGEPEPFRIVLDDERSDEQPEGGNGGATDDDDPDTEGPQCIPWIPIDPLVARHVLDATHPLYCHARPRTITVQAGQMLYLPAGWFHHVQQTCGTWDDGSLAPCVAVNYWYDMDYEGEKYVMRQMLGRLVDQAREAMAMEDQGFGA